MTKKEQDKLMSLFRDFLPAIQFYGKGEISVGKLMDCWKQHILGKEYTLPSQEQDNDAIEYLF